MTKLRTRHMALLLSVAAVAAAGCGSSSSKTTAKAPVASSTPSTPATPSTPSTTTTTPGQVSLSTPTDSPAFKTLLVKELEAKKLSAVKSKALASCISEQFVKHGIKTIGDITKDKTTSHQVAVGCGLGVGIASQIYGVK
jgi:hypothetical protein